MPDDTKTFATYRGRETSAALQRAARGLIVRQGFLATTIADITAEAGRSQASFYNYYNSKEDMLAQWAAELQRDALARNLDMPAEGLGTYEGIVHGTRAHYMTYKDRLAEVIAVQQCATINEDFARIWQDRCNHAIELIAKGIRRAQERGYCTGNDPRMMASAIMSMLDHACYTWLVQAHRDPANIPLDDETAIRTLADIWYRAVYHREPDDVGTR